MKYRKKPVVVDAWRINTLDPKRPDWVVKAFSRGTIRFANHCLEINTLEGKMRSPIGNYLIKGVHDELYACDQYIFEETYEVVPDAEEN